MQQRLIRLYHERFGAVPAAVLTLAGDGSSRAYRRLVGPGGATAVGVIGPDHDENRAFLSFTRAFRGIDLPVPDLLAADEPAGVYLLEDLGDVTLFDALEAEREEGSEEFPASLVPVYRDVVAWLPRFQVDGGAVADYSVAYPRAAFDRQSIMWDMNYFKYHFLKLAQVAFSEERLEKDFETLIDFVLAGETGHFLYRDFQSRNVMLTEAGPRFIDYQGGRRGALQYDIASLLYDAKANLPPPVRSELLAHYLDVLETRIPVDREEFEALYRGYVLVRIMQALGAYGYRGFFERKPRFLRSVPFAASNLRRLLDEGLPVPLPELEQVYSRIADGWARPDAPSDGEGGLVLHVSSFSYRRGYPDPVDVHGGGFVFDCRSMPNPGREPGWMALTGLDDDVRAYLEGAPETEPFWSGVLRLADGHIEEFSRRGFESVSIAFGCTGGQHRSVYFAERLASYVRTRHPEITVRLRHRERPHWPEPPQTP